MALLDRIRPARGLAPAATAAGAVWLLVPAAEAPLLLHAGTAGLLVALAVAAVTAALVPPAPPGP